jgi:hypothetical protein
MSVCGRSFFALVFAAALTVTHAYALCVVGDSVTSTVTPSGSTFVFDFSVLNGCNTVNQPFLNDFFVPYFSDAGISNIIVPDGWIDTIDTEDDLFGLAGAGVIDFEATTPLGYSFTSGFSYTADFDGVEGPFAMSLTTNGVGSTVFGDPLIPASPDTLAALSEASAPEPSTSALLAFGLFSMVPRLGQRLHKRRQRLAPIR